MSEDNTKKLDARELFGVDAFSTVGLLRPGLIAMGKRISELEKKVLSIEEALKALPENFYLNL